MWATSISPAFEWAQSGDWVYINAKMSHKLDAPATLNVVSEGVQMGKRTLKFAASKDQKRFELDLALHADIDPEVGQRKARHASRDTMRRRASVLLRFIIVLPPFCFHNILCSTRM